MQLLLIEVSLCHNYQENHKVQVNYPSSLSVFFFIISSEKPKVFREMKKAEYWSYIKEVFRKRMIYFCSRISLKVIDNRSDISSSLEE